jgi:TRAP-type C4-dicarboxylate transport system substrate-binding protein
MKIAKLSAALIVGVSAAAFAASAAAEEATLKGVSSFAKATAFSRAWEDFVEYVNQNGKGVLQINYIGGPEAVPPFEVGNAVQSGVVDIANVTSAYYTNLIPESDALHLATTTIQQQRENGCYELVNAMHEKKINAHYLARTGDNVPFHLYLTKPIDKPDLSGLTIRTTPVYRAFFESLGANLVRTAPGEVYTALERGSIDGYGWPIQGVLDLGWHERTKYRVDPGFYQVDVNFLVNLDAWNKLDDAQRRLLEKAAARTEEKNAENKQVNEEERRKQAEAGIETIAFTGADREKWLQSAQDEGWKSVAQVDRAAAEKLRACLSPAN